MENIRMIKINSILPHPDNPRKDMGDLKELTESIRKNGIYQNLTVVQKVDRIMSPADVSIAELTIEQCDDPAEKAWLEELKGKGYRLADNRNYIVVIGHRRLAAARLAGLTEVPCAVARMSIQKQVETMILENMQREDLTLFEQVKGFQQLLDFGDTVEGIAEKTGFSPKTVRRRAEIARLDPDTLERVMTLRAKQITLEDFDKLAKIEDIEERNKVLNDIGTDNFNYQLATAARRQKIRNALPGVRSWLAERNAEAVEEEDVW